MHKPFTAQTVSTGASKRTIGISLIAAAIVLGNVATTIAQLV